MAVRNFLDKDGLELYDELIKQKIDEVRASNFTAEDKEKFDGISEEANKVSYTQTLTSGTKIGELSIDDNSPINLYAPNPTSESDIARMGFTKNVGTITGITMNGASVGTSGNVNLGNFATVATSGDYNDLVNTPNIMSTDDIDEIIDQLPAIDELVFDDELSSTSENAVQNKVVTVALNNKIDKNGTDSLMTAAEHTKLNGIAAGAEVNVQSDWNQTTTTADDFIKNKPTLGTASALDVAESGNASATQVVKGNDSRLTDSRTPKSHTHTKSEITDFPTLGTASAKNVPSNGNAASGEVVMGNDSRLTDSRTPKSHTHTKSEITDFPTLGTAAAKDVPSSGNASTTQVVMGNDSRLTDSRNAKDVSAWAKASTKPTYTASEVGAIPSTSKGAASGVAELDANGKVPTSQLPAFVDDVLEYTAKANFPTTGETGKIYVDTTTNLTYRWSGTAYVEISPSLALGTTSSTAYYGDKGKVAYDHASAKGSAFSNGLYKITTNSEGHVTAATAVVKSDITALGIPASNTNTTYTLTQDSNDGHKFTFTGSDGTSVTITIPDNNTTYTLSSLGIGNVKNYDQSKAIKSITRSGTTFTYTCLDNTTGTFTQQDNNTWTAMVGATSSANGTAGYVPTPPKDGYNTKYLRADGTWSIPAYPTVNNATLTIQKNGTNVQTFTANQSTNVTANITVPTKTSELTNDSGYITNAGVTGVKGNSETNYRTGNVNITAANIGLGNVGNFKAVSTVASQGLTDTEKSNARANIGAGTSSFSGNYNDLSNKPTIPTVNNATLTIQKNGTNVQTFTANQASNTTANITVPTKVSELSNDKGFTTNTGTITGIKMNGASKGTSGVVDLGTVLTSHQDISGKVNKSGDTMTGQLTLAGRDLKLGTTGSSSDDSSDIAWFYGNGQEKARLWTANDYTAESGLHFRLYKKDGTSLFNGSIPLRNTWRGIQNNLTSTATDQSLSAAQGKALNEKITNWTAAKTLSAGTTSVTFTGLTSTYAYDLYSETADGTPVYTTGYTVSGTSITYTLQAITSGQAGTGGTGCKVKLKCLY